VDPYAWSLDAETFAFVPLLVAGYAIALRLYPTPRWRIIAFAVAIGLILGVFVTPIEQLSLHYLLLAHLLQNVVLAEWAPALLAVALPPALAAQAGATRLGRALTHPLVALPLWLVIYFAWHLPWPYDAALERPSSLLHLEHLSYLVAGVLLWWPVFHDSPRRLSDGVRALYLFGAFALASPLGLLLALLPSALYDFYERAPRLWGLSALSDQQVAGVTMAVEQAIVFFAVFTVFTFRFLRQEERADRELTRFTPS
jgi:putative membrane protein